MKAILKKVLSFALVIALTAGVAIGGTVAYLTKDMGTKVNTFKVSNLDVVLTEEVDVITNGGGTFAHNQEGGADYIDLVPGDKITKKVSVTNTGKEDAYVRVTVTMNNADIINEAIDEFYEGKGYPADAVQAMYNYIFEDWGINYDPRPGAAGVNDARGVIDGTYGLPEHVLKVDFAKTTDYDNDTFMFGIENWYKNEIELNATKYSTHPAKDGYYTSQLVNDDATAEDERDYVIMYTYYIDLPAGEDTTLFQGLNIPEEFDADQLAMFDGLKIDIQAEAIQAANFATARDAFDALANGAPTVVKLVESFEDLKAAVAEGGMIILQNDVEATETMKMIDGQNVIIDLNGKIISANEVQGFFVASGTLTIKNGTIEENGASRFVTFGTSSATDPVYQAGVYGNGTFENVNFVNHNADRQIVHVLGNAEVDFVKCSFDVCDAEGNAVRPIDAYNWGNGIMLFSEGTSFTYNIANNDVDWAGWNDYSVYRHLLVTEGCKIVEEEIDGKTWYTVKSDTENYVFVDTAEELASALENANTAGKNIAITADIDMTGVRFTSPTINNYCGNGTGEFIIDGGYHTVSGLEDMLIAYTGSAKLVEVRRLTLDGANIAVDVDDVSETTGVGAFIGYAGTSVDINLYDCHLVNSNVEGGHWTGGLVGYAAGYSGTDGPVFETLEMKWSSVKNSNISGKGSVGGFIGHATGDNWTKTEIRWFTISNNNIISTGDSTVKAGSVMGTVGCAGKATTVTSTAGVTATKTGGVDVHRVRSIENNNVASNNVANDKIYGRQGSSTGVLVYNGTVVTFE